MKAGALDELGRSPTGKGRPPRENGPPAKRTSDPRWVQPYRRGRTVLPPARPFWLRQDHAAALHRRTRDARQRRDPPGRQSSFLVVKAGQRTAEPAGARNGVPVLCNLAA